MGILDGLLGQLTQGAAGQQGLGGLVGSLLGGTSQGAEGGAAGGISAALLPAVLGWVQQQGGVGNAVSALQTSGLGAEVQSWVSNGANQAMDPQAISQLMSSDQVSALAAKAGLSPEDVQSGVAALLPHVINHLTPNGEVSDTGESGNLLSAALGKLGGLLG